MSKKKIKAVVLDMMYRDGANYKTGEEFYFTNKKNIPLEEIKEVLTKAELLGDDGFIPHYYKLPTLAPIENEFVPIFGNSDDHSFMSLQAVDIKEVPDNFSSYEDADISEVLETTKSDYPKEMRKKDKEGAIKYLRNSADELEKMKL